MPLTTASFMLRSSLALSFSTQKRMDITYPHWLQSLLHRFLHTNEERSMKDKEPPYRVRFIFCNPGPKSLKSYAISLGLLPTVQKKEPHSLKTVPHLSTLRLRGSFLNAGPSTTYKEAPGYTSRDQNTSASQLTTVQVVNGIKGSVKRIGGCVQFHLALGGQGHELNQVIVVAHQVANKVDLGGDNIDGRNSECA